MHIYIHTHIHMYTHRRNDFNLVVHNRQNFELTQSRDFDRKCFQANAFQIKNSR